MSGKSRNRIQLLGRRGLEDVVFAQDCKAGNLVARHQWFHPLSYLTGSRACGIFRRSKRLCGGPSPAAVSRGNCEVGLNDWLSKSPAHSLTYSIPVPRRVTDGFQFWML